MHKLTSKFGINHIPMSGHITNIDIDIFFEHTLKVSHPRCQECGFRRSEDCYFTSKDRCCFCARSRLAPRKSSEDKRLVQDRYKFLRADIIERRKKLRAARDYEPKPDATRPKIKASLLDPIAEVVTLTPKDGGHEYRIKFNYCIDEDVTGWCAMNGPDAKAHCERLILEYNNRNNTALMRVSSNILESGGFRPASFHMNGSIALGGGCYMSGGGKSGNGG